MSATNRGAARQEQDFYATPLTAFEPLIPFLPRVQTLEPACGDGRLARAMVAAGIPTFASDLYPQGDYTRTDFLQIAEHWPCIVTNPPFSLAHEFCAHAVEHAEHVFMLLRLNFLASKKRKAWWIEHEPDAIFVLSERPKFCKNRYGKWATDACDYGWFYWNTKTIISIHSGIYHL